MIEKLVGRDKVLWLTIANKVNEIIDILNPILESIKEDKDEKEKQETKQETRREKDM